MPTVSGGGLWNRGLRARVFETKILLPHSMDHVFSFFADAANLECITPPALHFRILTPLPISMGVGTLIQYRLRLFGIPFGWTTRITVWNPPCCFVDEQIHGPYRQWIHTHTFQATPKGVWMHDHVQWALPLYPFGEWAAPVIGALIAWIFRYRARTIPALLQETQNRTFLCP
ncbi:MAG: SRPBCC family protein [Desulfosoma sp.]|uniref:SRPBCC family protein n=1 Tax=Desulfosoma sp. TaxID=2603217 RepID=UPI00404B3D8F